MSHFAHIIPTQRVDIYEVDNVIVAEQDFINSGLAGDPTTWIQTSYNTRFGIHYGQDGEPDGGNALRGNYAMIGGLYDKTNDKFYAKQPYSSWTLDTTRWDWQPPVPMPTDGKLYNWDETSKSWITSLSTPTQVEVLP